MKINTINHFIGDAAKSLRRNSTISLASIITVFITFFILGTFLLVGTNFSKAISSVEDKIELKVWLDDDIKLIDKREVEIKLREQPGVKEIKYESREEAYKNFEGSTNGAEGLLKGYTLESNPFPASYIVELTDPSFAEEVSKSVKELPGVEDIGNQQDLIETISSVVKGVRTVGFILFVVMIGISIFLIMNTTKLTVFSRRREVGIMKFVGATDWFIRWPFIIEGMIIGLVGAIIAIIVLFFGYKAVFSMIVSNMLLVDLVSPSYVISSLLVMFGLGGIISGGIASFAALRKFLVV
ncbi:MAG: permease-like cell division protein FtsX [Clostridium sp.]